MSKVSFTREVACERDRIRQLLLNEDFLRAYVADQHPVDNVIIVKIDQDSSTTDWGVPTDGIPDMFRGFVGKTVPITLAITPPGITPEQDGSIHLDLKGKVSGKLRASLNLLPASQDPANTIMAVRGPLSIHISVPFLSGTASNMARDHLVIPVLEELALLLEQWAAAPPS
jgi:Protein of unknown function (DUF2505)